MSLDWDRARKRDQVANGERRARKPQAVPMARWGAKYRGVCVLCEGTITPGERVCWWSRPRIAHVDCVAKHVGGQ